MMCHLLLLTSQVGKTHPLILNGLRMAKFAWGIQSPSSPIGTLTIPLCITTSNKAKCKVEAVENDALPKVGPSKQI